jgi:hypothetical protein
VYARASAGIYEEMYAGAGGQVLYLPRRSNWAADLSVDWLKQRNFSGGLGFQDYSTVTALGALHYRLPMGMTATVRTGRFLARDRGARFEFKRRFPSGFEMGAWYTLTNGNDISSPGTPDKPYHDKGVFLSMPLSTMLTKDTQARADFAVAPWTRDVGQVVASPGDLYNMLENPLLNMNDRDGMVRLGDVEDDYNLPQKTTALDRLKWAAFRQDLSNASGSVMSDETLKPIGWGVGVTLLSSAFDLRLDRLARNHQQNSLNKAGDKYAKLAPVVAMGVSGLLALDQTDERLNTTAFTSAKAGVVLALAVEGSKFLIGRSRPEAGNGSSDFHPLDSGNGNTAFPSGHTAVMWAALTPYAKEYEMPWLYGVAALTNIGRVAGREHWFSDTVGGAFLGYAVGSLMWESQRKTTKQGAEWMVSPSGVAFSWKTD